MNRILHTLLAAVLLMASACTNDNEPAKERVALGDAIPTFTVQAYTGGNFASPVSITSQQLTGKPLMLVFFSTTCPDCQQQLPIVSQLAKNYGDGLQILCIGRKEPLADVKAYWEAHHFTMPVAPQDDDKVFRMFADSGVPRIYLFGSDGKAKYVFGTGNAVSYETLMLALLTVN